MGNDHEKAMTIALARSLVALLVVSLTGGCGPGLDFAERPGQAEATSVAWLEYGATSRPPPVAWHTQADLDCGPPQASTSAPNNGWSGPYDPGDRTVCVAGLFWTERGYAEVALPDGYRLSQTALAHELYHAALLASDPAGWGDPDHAGPGWRTLVPLAQAAMAAEGL